MSAGTYIYAIVAHDRALPAGLTGCGDSTLAMVVKGSLAAVTGPLPPSGLQRTTENVLRHGAIVEALHQQGPTLPVRFGTVVPNDVAVARALAEREAELSADLARLGDKVEFGLTALWDRPIADHAGDSEDSGADDRTERGPGTRYLRARLAVARREDARRELARSIAREIDAALAPQVLDRRCSLAPTDRLAIRAAYLIEPSRFEGCRRAIDDVRRRHPDLRVLVSGPWPPYSFVGPASAKEQELLSQSLNEISRWRMSPPGDGAQAEWSAASARAY
jgi:hypothetical protein